MLPESFIRPRLLWWVWLAPQVILLLLNVRWYTLVRGEMSAVQHAWAWQMVIAQVCLLLFGAALASRRKPVGLGWCSAILIAHVAYLWRVTQLVVADLLPATVTTWILPPENVLYGQYTFVMPALFYATLRLACFPTSWSASQDIKRCLVGALWVPFSWLLVYSIMDRLWHWRPWAWEALLIPAFVLSTLFFMVCFLRLLVRFWGWLIGRGALGIALLTTVVAIAGPLGGLLLNRTIPFPADYQCRGVYLLAILNGLALLIPRTGRRGVDLIVWIAQAALFPFTFYFFLVFLPFLPLALMAVLAAGAGFLILVPSALFFVHGAKLLDGLREARLALRPAWARAALLAALAAMPAVYTTQALLDRVALHQALRQVFHPDFSRADRFNGSAAMVRRGLVHMREFKEGRQLPFLSGYYNWLVFNGLTLPTPKLQQLHQAFFGGDLPKPSNRDLLRGFFGKPQPSFVFDSRTTRPFRGPDGARLADLQSVRTEDGPLERNRLTLTLTNTASAPAEFVTNLSLPPGVLVSGFWLTIGQERVPGRLVERKTAEWVYQMIRDATRRDPGLLTYTSFTALELRVFPVAANEMRTVEIEFLYPRGWAGAAAVGDRNIELGEKTSNVPPVPLWITADTGTATLLLPERPTPTTPRQPYLHFIIDRSAGTIADPSLLVEQAAARFPGISECMVSLANYETEDVCTGLTPIREAARHSAEVGSTFAAQGGFCRDRAVKRALFQAAARPANADVLKAPLIVVLQSTNAPVADEDGLRWFAGLAPDFPSFYVFRGAAATACGFDGTSRPVTECTALPDPVILLRCGSQVSAVPARGGAARFEAKGPVQVYDSTVGAFVPLETADVIPPQSPYARGMSAWADFVAMRHNPALALSLWPRAVTRSREAGVLLPVTAWIVVENSAQWQVLDRKQKQKLRNAEELEIQSVPDSPIGFGWVALALLPVLLLSIWTQRSPVIPNVARDSRARRMNRRSLRPCGVGMTKKRSTT